LSDKDRFEQNSPVSKAELSERETFRQSRLDFFWSLWSKDYLHNLPPVVNKLQAKGNLTTGSVVLIKDENMPRLKWPLGLVVKLFPGKDGKVRCVELKTSRGIVVRSIQKLCDLDVNDKTPVTPRETLQTMASKLEKTVVPIQKTRAGRISKPVQKLIM
jgi:hypothetical protein